MTDVVVGIGHIATSNSPETRIKTYALGSCVAVVLLCPESRGVGMIHIALADSSVNKSKAAQLPGYFADTGFPELLKKMALMNNGRICPRMWAKIAGGASMIQASDVFNIGRRNIEQVKKLLAATNIPIKGEDTGGSISRTVSASIDTGEVELSSPGRPNWKI